MQSRPLRGNQRQSRAITCNHVHSEAIGGSAHHGAPHRKALAVLRLIRDVDEEGDARCVAREERRDERHVQVHAFQNERLVRQLERGDEALNMAREQLEGAPSTRGARAVVSTCMQGRSSGALNVPG